MNTLLSRSLRRGQILLVASVLVCLGLSVSTSNAQISRVDRYQLSTFSGSFSSIYDDGNYVTSGDDSYSSFSLPFDFNYDSTDVAAGTQIYVYTNGYMSIGRYIGNYEMNVPGSSGDANAMAPFDFDGRTDDGIYYEVTGSSPNRVLTIEWVNFSYWSGASTSCNIQVKLHETSNIVEFLYDPNDEDMGSAGKIGINGTTSPSFVYQTYSSSTESTPSSDLRWTPAPPPVPPSRITASTHSIDFGNLTVGNDSVSCVDVTALLPYNTAHVVSVGLTGNPDFTIVSGSLAAGDSIVPPNSGSVCVDFAPIAAGNRTAQLVITTDAKDSGTINVDLRGGGVAPVMVVSDPGLFRKVRLPLGDSLTQCFDVQSQGTGPLTITGVTITGTNPDQYVVSSYPSAPIAPGQSGTICITYVPTYEGRPDAQVYIQSNALVGRTATLTTFGLGILPHFAFIDSMGTMSTEGAMDFDSVEIGKTVCRTQTITNPGTDTLLILKNYKSSGDYDFTVTPLSGTDTILAPGQSASIGVCFTPLDRGFRVATVRFATNIHRTFPSPGLDTSNFLMQIQGTGVPFGLFSVSGPAIDTGVVGIQNCVSDTIRNTGSADMTVMGWALGGPDSAEFAISGATFPFTLQPGDMKVVDLCFTAGDRGLRMATLAVQGMSGGSPLAVTLPVTGFGVEVCAQTAPTAMFGPKPLLLGTTDSAVVTVTNCGDVPTTYTPSFAFADSAYTVQPTQSPVVAAGGTTQFTVYFQPQNIGANADTLIISGGVYVTPMSVALRGIGGGVIASSTVGDGDTVDVGSCNDVTMTVTNAGNMDWTPGAPTISDPAWTFVSLVPSTVLAGGTATLTLKFCPSTTGSSTTTITFPSATPAAIGGFTATADGFGAPTGGVAEQYASFGYKLGANFPNPFTGRTQLTYETPEEGPVQIVLMDVKGEVVQTLESGRVSQGTHTLTIDSRGLPSGTYYCVLSAGSIRISRTVTVAK